MYIPKADKLSTDIELSLIDLRPDARPHAEEEIQKLATSLKMRQLQNIIVCKNGKRYELIAGVGRFLAAQKAELGSLKADVYDGLAEAEKLSIMFDENEARENVPTLYQAKLFQAMLKEDGRPNLTQQQLATALGKDQTTISKYLALQSLSPLIQDDMNRFINLGIKHFMQLLRIKNADLQWKVAKVAAEKDFSASDLQQLVNKRLGINAGAKKMGRPKNRKSLSADGFEVIRKKDQLMIRGVLPVGSDVDAYLAKLRSELIRLGTSKPKVPQLAENNRN